MSETFLDMANGGYKAAQIMYAQNRRESVCAQRCRILLGIIH